MGRNRLLHADRTTSRANKSGKRQAAQWEILLNREIKFNSERAAHHAEQSKGVAVYVRVAPLPVISTVQLI
jgi:hypothetical protein